MPEGFPEAVAEIVDVVAAGADVPEHPPVKSAAASEKAGPMRVRTRRRASSEPSIVGASLDMAVSCFRGRLASSSSRRWGRRTSLDRRLAGTCPHRSQPPNLDGAGPVPAATAPCDDRVVNRSILLVDDHAGFRAEARAMLEADGYEVIGEAANGAAAVAEANRLGPDIVLLDVGLPDASGLDLVTPIRSAAPGTLIVLISSRQAGDYGERLSSSGADGFIDKASLSPQALAGVLPRRARP
jgi:CheY-like chemotaxis protein